MWFIIILIMFCLGYYLGTMFSLPSIFSKLNKKKNDERDFFLSSLEVGDEITIRNQQVHYMIEKVMVKRNDPLLQAIELGKFFSDGFTLQYDDDRLLDIVYENIFLANDKFKQIK